MRIKGGKRDDILAATIRTKKVLGLGGDDTLRFADFDAKTKFVGGSGDDRLTGPSLDLRKGGKLKDLAGVIFDGGKGFDVASIEIIMDAPKNGAVKLGKFAAKTKMKSVEVEEFDLFVFQDSNRPKTLRIDGTGEDDAVSVRARGYVEGSDVVVKTKGGDDYVNVELFFSAGVVRIDTGGGNDVVRFFNGDGASLKTRGGKDTVFLNGVHDQNTVEAGGGADRIFLDGSLFDSDQVISGGGGNDRFYVRMGESHGGTITDFRAGKDKLVLHDAEILPGIAYTLVDVTIGEGVSRTASGIVYDTQSGELFTKGQLSAVLEGDPDLDLDDFRLVNEDLYPGAVDIFSA